MPIRARRIRIEVVFISDVLPELLLLCLILLRFVGFMDPAFLVHQDGLAFILLQDTLHVLLLPLLCLVQPLQEVLHVSQCRLFGLAVRLCDQAGEGVLGGLDVRPECALSHLVLTLLLPLLLEALLLVAQPSQLPLIHVTADHPLL
jgi:hypothetical protein